MSCSTGQPRTEQDANRTARMKVNSEGPLRITRATIEAAWRRRKPRHRLIIRDSECRGLALIVNATSMTWSYAYRPRGIAPATGRRWPNRTVTLGNPETHSPDEARIAANHLKGQAAAGADPAAERKAAAEAEQRKRERTFGRLVEDYARALPRRPKMQGGGLPSPRYVAEEVSQLRRAVAGMEATAVADFWIADVRRVIDAVSERTASPRARFGALSRFLDWCLDAGHIDANPCAQMARASRPKAPQPRAHCLLPAELGQLWRAAEQLNEPVWRDLARFLIAVPCRRTEAACLEWSHINLDAAEWRQPGRLTKNREPHRLHLHELAIDVLRARRAATDAGGLVFPAPVSGDVVKTFNSMKLALGKATGLCGWTWHDMRRSFATALGEAGVVEAVADAVLNHRQSATRGGVLGVYQRASRWPEQVKAMELWGRLLAAAIEGREAEVNVVPITARAG
jgi:integrase